MVIVPFPRIIGMLPVYGGLGVQAKEKQRQSAWRVVVRQELIPWVCWILTHSFNKHLNVHTCLALDGMGKLLEVQGSWARAVRGGSGRAALTGIAKRLH